MKKFSVIGYKRGDYFKTESYLGSVQSMNHKSALKSARKKFPSRVVVRVYLAAKGR